MSHGATPDQRPVILFLSPSPPDGCRGALEEMAGFVFHADSAERALPLLESNFPDLAFVDMDLPGPDWLHTAGTIKEHDPDVPVILMGSDPSREDLMQGMRLGADLFLTHPMKAETVLAEASTLARRAAQVRFNRLRQSTAAAVLDATPAPTVITDGVNVHYLNRPMMELAGVKPRTQPRRCEELEELLPLVRLHAVDDHSDFFRWIRIALNEPEREHLVRVVGNSHDKTYLMRTAPLDGLAGKHSISFADVTSIENERRLFHRLATTDPLTGVYNRRKFMEKLDSEIARAGRYGTTLSLIMVDIDDFKSINDTMGHQAGDVALVELACLLKENIRSMDMLARYGGEEFTIIIPQTGLEGAQCMAAKLCSRVSDTAFAIAPDMTCSMGVASFQEGDTVHTLIERADKGLYEAKAQGKNRSVPMYRLPRESKDSKAI